MCCAGVRVSECVVCVVAGVRRLLSVFVCVVLVSDVSEFVVVCCAGVRRL